MTKITFIEYDGTEHPLDIENGTTLMQAAINNSVHGIMADCGGACSCATCHVYVDAAFADKLPENRLTELLSAFTEGFLHAKEILAQGEQPKYKQESNNLKDTSQLRLF